MSKVTMMRGLPASGKSTLANKLVELSNGKTVRVNRDLLREMMHNSVWSPQNEKDVIHVQYMIAEHAIDSGKDVIIDDCNLGDKHETMWKTFADDEGAEFAVIDVKTPMSECITRNEGRESLVTPSIIQKIALQYGLNDYVNESEGVVIVDIDGTIADCSHRQHHVRGDGKNWKEFFAGMSDDTPRNDVLLQVYELRGAGYEVILVSARPDNYQEVTQEWLKKHTDLWDAPLLMRSQYDKRPDTEVKSSIYDRYLSELNIVNVFDDRPSVIRMWEEKGLEVIDVGFGEEF